MKEKDIQLLKAHGINIVRDHSRDFAEFKAVRNGVETVHKFRIQYQDKYGNIATKDSTGRAVNCREFTAEDIIKLCTGHPVKMHYTSTSDIVHDDYVVLGRYVNQFGNEAIRPLPI